MKKLMLFILFLLATNAIATPVNVNTADAKAISDALNGIGMKKAEAIIKYRTEKGLFNTIEDLRNVKGIGQKTLDKNKQDILLTDTPTLETPPVITPPPLTDLKAVEQSKTAKTK
jgi:competence protein ComEA